MPFSWEARGGTHTQLTWNELSREIKNSSLHELKPSQAIARCLRTFLEKFEESEFIRYLVAPSPSSMALFFQVQIAHVYQALKTLELQGFIAETSSHYSPIILWDPQVRENPNRRTESLNIHYPESEFAE